MRTAHASAAEATNVRCPKMPSAAPVAAASAMTATAVTATSRHAGVSSEN